MTTGKPQAGETTSLYRFFAADGELLYIGITNSVPRRFDEHGDKKPWFTNAVRVTLEHHPNRAAALGAEKRAIKAERPKFNIVHNHGRQLIRNAEPAKGRWRFRSRESGYEREADLQLYPELDCSAMVDDCGDLDGEGQLAEYVRYLGERYPEWLESDAVPIIWSVHSQWRGVFEAAPFTDFNPSWGDFLAHYSWPEDVRTGERLDWYRLPVVNDRFPEFAEALAWTPSPLQPSCPLRSILASRSGYYHPETINQRRSA